MPDDGGLPVAASFTPPPPPPPDPLPVGVLSFGMIRKEVRARLGELSEDFWTDEQINRHINDAQRRFSMERRWSWLFTTVTGLTIPAHTQTMKLRPEVSGNRHFDLLMTRSGETWISEVRRVSPSTGADLRRRFFTTEGRVLWYYFTQGQELDQNNPSPNYQMVMTVRFVPTPDVSYTAEYLYVRNPALLVNDTDIPDVPVNYVEALVAWAAGTLWLNELNGGTKAQEQFNLYNKVLKDAMNDEATQADDSPIAWGKQEPEFKYPFDPMRLLMRDHI